MIEIVFGDSACGGLKMAQHYGEGEFTSSIDCSETVVLDYGEEIDKEILNEEIRLAKQKFIEKERLAWEKGTPMGGNPNDVYGFHFMLSIGDISEDIPGEKRAHVLEWLYSIYPDIEEDLTFAPGLLQAATTTLAEICNRISSGEAVRIWYSDHPDELCGLYWFMSQLNRLNLQNNQIFLVKLPTWEITEDGNLVAFSGWGEVNPGQWHRYLTLQTEVPLSFCSGCAAQWQRLQAENAPLRAVLNGQLVSMPETLYDEFILREIDAQAEEFDETMVIGKVLGKYALGIGDAWIAHRIETMIKAGNLAAVTKAAPGHPMYHRRLKKMQPPKQ